MRFASVWRLITQYNSLLCNAWNVTTDFNPRFPQNDQGITQSIWNIHKFDNKHAFANLTLSEIIWIFKNCFNQLLDNLIYN